MQSGDEKLNVSVFNIIPKEIIEHKEPITVNSQSCCGLDVSTDACVYIAVLRRYIKDPQLEQSVSLPHLVFLSVPDDLISPLPPLHAVTRLGQLTAESCGAALLDQHVLQLLLEGDWER